MTQTKDSKRSKAFEFFASLHLGAFAFSSWDFNQKLKLRDFKRPAMVPREDKRRLIVV